jgi:hypothetical protein
MIQCPVAVHQMPTSARMPVLWHGPRPPALTSAAAELRRQLLGMSLGAEDFNTICLPWTWTSGPSARWPTRPVGEMLVRQLEDEAGWRRWPVPA